MTPLTLPGPTSDGAARLVFIGDIVGKPGMRITCDAISWLRSELKADAIIANAENAADGSGLRCKDYRRLMEHGLDAITLGDHAFRKKEIFEVLTSESNIVRPANLPESAPGNGSCTITTTDGVQIGIIAVMGRVFMKPVDCPFRAADRELSEMSNTVHIRLVDFHAEATSDMQLMGRYLDGRASAVLGTHTHVATADEQILPGDTAYQSDVGMTGPFESILGRKIPAVMEATLNALPTPFQVATGDVQLNATWIDVSVDTGKALDIGRLAVRESTITDHIERKEASRKLL